MFNNYLYLLRGLIELKEIICDKEIADIYTQEKDKLFLRIPLKDKPDFTLILSTQPQFSYLQIKADHKKAKKNTRVFFEENIPSKIIDVVIADNDRTVKILLDNGAIYFLIRSVRSNIFFFSSSRFESFKKVDKDLENITIAEIQATRFITPDESVKNITMKINNYSYDEIITQYRFIDKSLINYFQGDNWKSKLIDVIDSIMNEDVHIQINDNNTNISFVPSLMKDINADKHFTFPSYFDALNKFLALKHIVKRDISIKKELEKYLSRENEKLSNKLNDLKAKLEIGSRENEFSFMGNLLLANFNQIRKGMDSITLFDNVSNKNVPIPLNKTLTPNQNIDRYFEKAKAEKINFLNARNLYKELETQYNRYKEILEQIKITEDYNQLMNYKKELGIKNKMESLDKSSEFSFKHFLIDGKYHLFVGKNSKNNDELTTKYAKQNDLWFHARSVSGSHVVLRVENTKEPIPKNIIKKAASVAAYFSKAKTSKLAPVSYTFKKYVSKRKDLEPGQVILLREQVILVPPEIPVGCVAVE